MTTSPDTIAVSISQDEALIECQGYIRSEQRNATNEVELARLCIEWAIQQDGGDPEGRYLRSMQVLKSLGVMSYMFIK